MRNSSHKRLAEAFTMEDQHKRLRVSVLVIGIVPSSSKHMYDKYFHSSSVFIFLSVSLKTSFLLT